MTGTSVRLSFVRHAQARGDDGYYDEHTPLSPLGRRQAVATAAALGSRARPAAMYTSPYARCVGTAEAISRELRIEVVTDPRLREFEFEKALLSEILNGPNLSIWSPDHRGKPDGETLSEFSGRVASYVQELADEHLGSQVVLVTHSGVIDAAIRWLTGLPPESPWIHDFPVSTGSITEVDVWPHGRTQGGPPRYAAFLRIGDCSHLVDCRSEM